MAEITARTAPGWPDSRAYRGASHTRRSFPAASRMIVPSIRAYSVLREEPGDVLIVGVCGDLEELDFCRIWRSRGGYLANSVGPRGVILCRRSDRYFPRLRSGRKAGNSRCRPPIGLCHRFAATRWDTRFESCLDARKYRSLRERQRFLVALVTCRAPARDRSLARAKSRRMNWPPSCDRHRGRATPRARHLAVVRREVAVAVLAADAEGHAAAKS